MKGNVEINGFVVDLEKIRNPKIKMILEKEGEDFWFRHRENYTDHRDSDYDDHNHRDHNEHREYGDHHEKYSDGSCQQ